MVTATKKKEMLQNPEVAQKHGIKITLSTAWVTKEVVTSAKKLRATDIGIPGFPKVEGAIIGFHAESALMAGPMMAQYAARHNAECKFINIETECFSETQKDYPSVLQSSEPASWPQAGILHLGKAKNILKNYIASYVKEVLIDERGVNEEIVFQAENNGFEHLINLDVSILAGLLKSKEFPNLQMLIVPMKPKSISIKRKLPNVAIVHPSAVKEVTVQDVFKHQVVI